MGHKSRGLSFPIMIHETVLSPGWFAAFFVSDFLFFYLHRRNSFLAAWQKNDFCLLQGISIQKYDGITLVALRKSKLQISVNHIIHL